MSKSQIQKISFRNKTNKQTRKVSWINLFLILKDYFQQEKAQRLDNKFQQAQDFRTDTILFYYFVRSAKHFAVAIELYSNFYKYLNAGCISNKMYS